MQRDSPLKFKTTGNVGNGAKFGSVVLHKCSESRLGVAKAYQALYIIQSIRYRKRMALGFLPYTRFRSLALDPIPTA